MLTAKNISEVVELLKMIEHATIKQWEDPQFLGMVRGHAFIVGLPLRMELERHNVEVEKVQETS